MVATSGIEPESFFKRCVLSAVCLPISPRRLNLVGLMGIEPIRSFEHRYLKPARLPIPSQPRLFKRLSPHR
jgi:hypothetical protein